MNRNPFHPFNPRPTRYAFLAGGLVCVALTAWAIVNVLQASEPFAWVRALLSGAMAAAFVFAFTRLRPREDWGIHVGPRTLTVSRPFTGEPIEVPWREVLRVARTGKGNDRLVVISEQGPLVIARQLFPSKEAFEKLAEDLESHAPEPRYDA